MSRIFSVLSGVPLFSSGEGDFDDVLAKIRSDAAGAWFPVVHVGNYFIGTEERYRFADKGSYGFVVSIPSGSVAATGTITISGLIHDPTKFGPVFVWSEGCPRPFKRVCSPLRAFRLVNPSVTGDLWSFTVPSSGILVSLVSDPITGILTSVPSSGSLRTTEQYFYAIQQGKVYLRGDTLPSLYATYLVGEQDPDLLRQEEILVVDRDGLIRTQYKNVLLLSDTPVIRKPTSTGPVVLHAVSTSGNVITPPSTGGISSGDVVAVEYYVQNSFTAVPIYDSGGIFGEAKGLKVQYIFTTSGIYALEYETSDVPWYDTSLLPSGSTDYIQLNPLITQRESGFLYITDVDTPYPTPTSLQIDISNLYPSFSTTGGGGFGSVAFSVTVLDSEGQAVPEQPVQVVTVTGNGAQAVVFPANQHTNGRGQVVYAWSPTGSGLVTLNAFVTGTTVSGTISFFYRDIGFYRQQSELRLGKLLLNLEDTPYRDNLFRLSAYYCYEDGAPFEPADGTNSRSYSITFVCQTSQFYTLTGQPVPKVYPTFTNPSDDGIATILVNPIPGDVIRARVDTDVPGRFRYSAPIFVPLQGSL